MILTKLFEMQDVLDKRIVKEKGLEGQDLLSEKILALQVELAECANEWRGFKFWSRFQNPRTEHKVACHACRGEGYFMISVNNDDEESCGYCEGTGLQEDRNPLLEEYVDCLHFILSIGLDIDCMPVVCDVVIKYSDVNTQFRGLNQDIVSFDFRRNADNYHDLLKSFKGLGELLGFTWDKIEQAYYDKNEINHERQASGY